MSMHYSDPRWESDCVRCQQLNAACVVHDHLGAKLVSSDERDRDGWDISLRCLACEFEAISRFAAARHARRTGHDSFTLRMVDNNA